MGGAVKFRSDQSPLRRHQTRAQPSPPSAATTRRKSAPGTWGGRVRPRGICARGSGDGYAIISQNIRAGPAVRRHALLFDHMSTRRHLGGNNDSQRPRGSRVDDKFKLAPRARSVSREASPPSGFYRHNLRRVDKDPTGSRHRRRGHQRRQNPETCRWRATDTKRLIE
jgi:hypothetical protein